MEESVATATDADEQQLVGEIEKMEADVRRIMKVIAARNVVQGRSGLQNAYTNLGECTWRLKSAVDWLRPKAEKEG